MKNNIIYNEDCLITLDKIDEKSIDVVLTSPPYNMTKRKGGYADTGRYDVYQDWKTEEEYILSKGSYGMGMDLKGDMKGALKNALKSIPNK